MLVDTDVLIWLLRGRSSAKAAIEACPSVELSAITYMELLQGVRSKAECSCFGEQCGAAAGASSR